jgi:aldose 1-epimerase
MPLLFPFCGPTRAGKDPGRFDLNGGTYYMPKHGFLYWQKCSVDSCEVDSESVRLRLRAEDSEMTRRYYPFSFVSEIRYTLFPKRLRLDWHVSNCSEIAMPLAPGLHPYYRAPMVETGAKNSLLLTTRASRRYLLDGQDNCWSGEEQAFEGGTFAWGRIPGFPFTIGGLGEPEYRLSDPAAGVTLKASWSDPGNGEGGPFLNLYTPHRDTPAVCVEPFVGLQNALDHGRGLVRLAPGQDWRWRFELEVGVGSSGDESRARSRG